MNLIDPIRTEFQFETGATRKVLDRVPDEHFGWKPHEKSWTLGELASHIAEAITWVRVTLETDELVMDPATYNPWRGTNRGEVLEKFDETVADALVAMEGQTDEHLLGTWSMKVGDTTAMALPRLAVLKSFVINHQIHHRAQLGVYLRLKDVPVPQVYGPTADEPNMVMG